MSNEELVTMIQSGEYERMGELWGQVEKFIAWKAQRMMTTLDESSTIEVDDLIQSGYFALVAAVKSYKAGSSIFVKWLSYYLQTAFAEAVGYRTTKMQNDPMKWALSLDNPIGENGDSTFGEIVPDYGASATMENIEESLWQDQLKNVEIELLDNLHKDQRAVLHNHYFKGQRYQECAATMGVTVSKVRTLMANGIKELRRPHNQHRLKPFYEFDYFGGTGLTAFKETGMSVQEKYLIREEELSTII